MELTEPVESINQQLVDRYGIDTVTGLPLWRIVWSEDQYEMRLGTYDDYTPAGLYIRTVTEVRNVPKYKQWIKQKYVLENLTIVPEVNKGDLPVTKLSYEPIFVFETRDHKYLPPKLEAAQFVIKCIYAVKGKGAIKYHDPEAASSPLEAMAKQQERIAELEEDLFGDETDIGDALAHKEAIVVPFNYKKVN